MKPLPPYCNVANKWYTQVIFWEKHHLMDASKQVVDPVFCLYDDKPGLINCRTTFVALGDPTGYKWAMKYLKDYEHWKQLMKCSWFEEAYICWNNELKQKIRSRALDKIQDIADNGLPAQSLVAAKYLASFEWEKNPRGRPSKEELSGELKRQVKALEEEEDDFKRIGLVK